MMDSANQPARQPRRGAQILSTILFLAAIGFAAAGVYIYYVDDKDKPQEPPIPTTTPGRNGLADVIRALDASGLDADYGRSPSTAKSNQMDPPGQNLVVEGQNVFIFIFPGADAESARTAREAAAANLDATTMTLSTPNGQDVSKGETLSISQGSNVIAVLVGGDDKLAKDVQGVIENLP